MHSILESDGVFSDPYEVLCHMGTLIIEGRTPKSVGETAASGETSAKVSKPYNEGPHCPNFIKLYNKDTHTVHKCSESSITCIRYNNLKQHLQTLQQKSPSVSIEVSLGPDCLCGELRSQSTLVSTQACKRDVILEQWTITIGHKQMRESSSQMSVMNLYQAVRSLLHFSQLTAWYMSNNGMKPAHVIYRVGFPEDSTFICDDDFVSHDFPIADINKTVWMKISVKTLPRMEKIPSVFCPQHPSSMVETGHCSQEAQEPLHSKFKGENKDELLDSALPLKFQGVRKKTYESQERKRKKYITLYNPASPLGIENCSGIEFLDGMPIEVKKISPDRDEEFFSSKRIFHGDSIKSYQGESSKADYKKSKMSAFQAEFAELVKPQPNFESFDAFSCNYFEEKVGEDPTLDLIVGLKSFSDSRSKSDFRTKGKMKISGSDNTESSPDILKTETKTIMDILDDRMQISCAISGKHHCKWECEEENDLNNCEEVVEKPKRRRSLSRARTNDASGNVKLSSEKILHGKFKEIDCLKSCLTSGELGINKMTPGCSQTKIFLSEPSSKPSTIVDISNSSNGSTTKPQTSKIESLPLFSSNYKEASAVTPGGSSPREPSLTGRGVWVRRESFESFKKGCALTKDSLPDDSSESESELSDGYPDSSNPFLAAILRTTKKSKTSKPKKHCDSSANSSGDWEGKGRLFSAKPKDSITAKKAVDFKAKLYACEEVQLKNVADGRKETSFRSPKIPGKSCNFRRKLNSWRESDGGESLGESHSEFLPQSLGKLKSLFDTQDLKREERTSGSFEDLDDETGSNNLNSTKTIPVPSAHDKLKFRRSLDSAAQLVFHRCSGLPLTSSPAPVRRNHNSFSFDSTLNSVSAIKSALFESSNSLSSEDENESEGSLKSPTSPGAWSVGSKQINYHSLSPLPLLGSFEESVLNGRLEPVSTVQGFTAELGASGSFCPRHLHLPVTVFFYTLGDNDKVSAPYLGHINLGKKGYNVPRSGTIQVTLFNPLRTVVKMFVVVYDLHDMPPNSHTFLRQRTLYVPASQKESTWTDKKEIPFEQEDYHKYLRYLIHLRFVSGKTGRIHLHTDIRMVIFRKADEDTATALDDGKTYELRSHTHGPMNPKFSPRK